MRYLQTLAEHGWSPVRLQAVQAAATRWQHHLRRSVQRGLSAAAADRFAMSVLEPRLLMAAAPTAPTFATPTTLRAPTHAEVLAQEQSQQVAVQHIRTAISSAATLKTQLGQESEQFQNVLQQQQSDVPSPESLVTTLSTPRGGALSFTGGPRFESSRETFTGANFLLEVNPDYAGDVQVTVDGESHYVPLTGSLLLEGSQDSDALTLDFSNGDPMPSGGVSFDSGSGQIPLTIQWNGNNFPSSPIYLVEGDSDVDTEGLNDVVNLANVTNLSLTSQASNAGPNFALLGDALAFDTLNINGNVSVDAQNASLDINQGGQLNVSSGGQLSWNDVTLEAGSTFNNGGFAWGCGNLTLESGSLLNNTGNFYSGVQVTLSDSTESDPTTITNQGAVELANLTLGDYASFANSGYFDSDFAIHTLHVGSHAALTNSGDMSLSGGLIDIVLDANAIFDNQSDLWSCGDGVFISGDRTTTLSNEGSMIFASNVTVSGLTWTNTESVELDNGASGIQTFDINRGADLENEAYLTVASGDWALISSDAAGTIDFTGDLYVNGSSSLSVSLPSDAFQTAYDVFVDSSATLNINGSMEVGSAQTDGLDICGIVTVNGDLSVLGWSQVESGGTLNVTGAMSVPAGGEMQVQGALTVGGNVTVDNSYLETDSTLSISGHVFVQDNATFDMNATWYYSGQAMVQNNSFLNVAGNWDSSGSLSVDASSSFTPCGTFTLESGGTVTSEGNLYLGGTVQVDGILTSCGQLEFAGGSFTNDGILTLGGSASLYGPLCSDGDLTITGNLDGDGTISGDGCATIAGGSMEVASIQLEGLYVENGSVTLYNGNTPRDPNNASVFGTLDISSDGSLDIGNNAVIVTDGDSNALATLNTWAGRRHDGCSAGIFSSDSTPTTTVGVVRYGDLLKPSNSFSGLSLIANSILIASVANGDLNMDGTVDSSDLAILQKHLDSTAAGALWEQGDLNYGGTINQDDAAVIEAQLPASKSFPPSLTSAGMTTMDLGDTYQLNITAGNTGQNAFLWTVDWGDGNHQAYGSGVNLILQHSYRTTSTGNYTIIVGVTDLTNASSKWQYQLTTAYSNVTNLQVAPVTHVVDEGTTEVLVATFYDPGTGGSSADYSATVTWNGAIGQSAREVLSTGHGNFSVYSNLPATVPGSYSATTHVTGPHNLTGNSGTSTITVNNTASLLLSGTAYASANMLQWTSPASTLTALTGPLTYQITRSADGTTVTFTTATTAYFDSSVVAGTTYTYTVKALDTSDQTVLTSAPLTLQCLATDGSLPAPTRLTIPSNVSAFATDSTDITLSWSVVPGDTYEISRDGQAIWQTTSGSYSDSDLTPSTSYNYSVVAWDDTGDSSAPGTASTKTQTAPQLPAPQNLQAYQTGPTSIGLFWTAPTDDAGITGYSISQNGNVLATTSQTHYPITIASGWTSETYTVAACNAANQTSSPASATVKSPTTPPPYKKTTKPPPTAPPSPPKSPPPATTSR